MIRKSAFVQLTQEKIKVLPDWRVLPADNHIRPTPIKSIPIYFMFGEVISPRCSRKNQNNGAALPRPLSPQLRRDGLRLIGQPVGACLTSSVKKPGDFLGLRKKGDVVVSSRPMRLRAGHHASLPRSKPVQGVSGTT